MRFRVLDAAVPEELAAWTALWQAWPEREVMAHPEYVLLFATGHARAVAAVGEAPGWTILLPLLLRPVGDEPWADRDEESWDAASPYGYGGPFAWGDEPPDQESFWTEYHAWCARSQVVSTFLRLSLFLGQLTSIPGQVREHGPNIVVPLEDGAEGAWEGYDRDIRRNVRKSRSCGVDVEVDPAGDRLDAFQEVYEHTMERRRADACYRFPRRFFERLRSRLAGHFAFVHALCQGRVISSELALVSAENVYAFLGGTLQDAFHLFPNEAVRHTTVAWAASQGKRRYVLGGGYTQGDGIYRHKRLFAPRGEVSYRLGALMHDEPAYYRLARRRAASAQAAGVEWSPRPGFFPAYRG